MLQVVGQLTVHTTVSLRRAVDDEVSDACRCVVVDLAGVTFMDASGAVALSDFDQRIRRAGGDVSLVGTSRDVARLLRLCGATAPTRPIRKAG